MNEYTFSVSGMSCDHCKKRVEKVTSEIIGVISSKVDLNASRLTVQTSSNVIEDIMFAVSEAGYTATPIQ